MASKCIVHYYNNEQGDLKWRCGKYMMCSSVEFSEKSEKCYHYKCPGRKKNTPICAWKDCSEPVAKNKLRHCSEICRKRDNRWAYKQRQKLKLKAEKIKLNL